MNQTAISAAALVNDEHILVVKRTALFGDQQIQGLLSIDVDQYVTLINTKKEFLPRSLMETDPTYKQIIPYIIFTYDDRYFLMQRTAKATETRLQNKYSLGIGGHIRQEDMSDSNLFSWAEREFHEEVEYTGAMTMKVLGLLNDDSNPVGQVHVGFVILLQGQHGNIRVKSELKSGVLLSLQECADFYPSMENWSQIVYDALVKKGA